MIGKMLGNLKIVSKIGEGGMGVVYLAENLQLKKRFAVKSLSVKLTKIPGFGERFRNEALNQALLSHPNIVQAIDFFDENGQFFLVMEYVSGHGLNELIKKSGKLTEEDALPIFKDILRGLNFAHARGVIHRDIKPSNVIVDDDGRARITDFGIAILVGEERLTSPGTTVGSSWYMSPEQILHPAKIDHRSDVYSAGVVLYEMLTGDVPFDGESEFAIQNKQVKDAVPDPARKNPLISPDLKKIMIKALEKDPDERYSGCGEFLNQIQEYEKTKVIPPPERWKFLVATAAVVLIGIIVAYLYASKPAVNGPVVDAHDRIVDAQEKASFFCIENRAFKKVKDTIREMHAALDSESANEEDIVYREDLQRQLKEREANLHEYFDNYTDSIKKLSAVKKAEFEEELARNNEALANDNRFDRIQINKIVAQHYQAASSGDAFKVDIAVMDELCPEH